MSPDQVKKLLNVDLKQWSIIEENMTPKNDKRPPYHRLIIKVSNFSSLGEQGEARLSFFNNKLSSVWFYPVDLEKYKVRLEKEKAIKFDSHLEAHSSINTKIRIGKDYKGKPYVAFEDSVLENEHNTWISRYS